MHRLASERLPNAGAVERTPAPRATSSGSGRTIGTNANGAAVVVDVVQGYAARLDPRTGDESAQLKVSCAQDPLTPGLVAVDDEGRRALAMASRAPHGDPTLVLLDFDAKNVDVVRSFDGPGWIVGGFGTRTVIACEQRLGDAPRFSVSVQQGRTWRTVWSIDGMQPPCIPVAVNDDVVALLACMAPSPLTGTGPLSLCVLDIAGGAIRALAPAEGTRVRIDVTPTGRALVVDGGHERVRVALVD